jgi:hypothetical protein
VAHKAQIPFLTLLHLQAVVMAVKRLKVVLVVLVVVQDGGQHRVAQEIRHQLAHLKETMVE